MTVRKYTAGLAVAALAASGLILATLAPATADPTNPVFTPSATDLVGVGSDTIEGVVNDLAQGNAGGTGWNADAAHATERIASFDATPQPSTIVLRSAAWNGNLNPLSISRPNGSGQGKATLFGAGDNANVNFARSSSSLSATNGEAAALTQFPFAVDGLKMAVSGNVASHAPASLAIADIVKIYDGTYQTWNQIPGNSGGSTAAIHPLIPQTGSGTRNFFLSELKAANGGVDVVLDPGVTDTQEHSPTDIQGDADAIAPFSTARAQTLASSGAIHLEDGYSARRAVYIVVRNADAGALWATDMTGFFCSTAAKPIIEEDGFQQLATPANGGVCGVGVTTAVSNFTSNTVTTTTTLAATSPHGHDAHLVATVGTGGQGVPDGDVDFFEGATNVGSAIVAGGQATLDLTGVSVGDHTYTAKFVPANPASFTESASIATLVTVRQTSTTTATVSNFSYGHPATATAAVMANGVAAVGSVTFKVGATVVGAPQTLDVNGHASLKLPANLTAGEKTLTATYSGDATTAPSVGTKGFTVAKSAVVVSETFPAKVKAGKRAVGTVVVALSPGSTRKPTGSVVIKRGTKVVGKGTLVNGVLKIKLAKLPKGKNHLVAIYGGSANTLAKSLKFLIVQK
jgi:hypothetical protein